MKKHSRILTTICAVGLLGTSLIGCNKGPNYEVTVTFWHTMGQKLQKKLDTFIKEFHKIHPEIGIKHVQQGGWPDIEEKITAAIPAGTNPTMAYCYPDHVAEYMESNAIYNLDDFINGEDTKFTEEDGLVEDFIEMYWKEGSEYIKDGTYSLPYSKSTEAVFYNVDIFKDVAHHASGKEYVMPETWEDLEKLLAEMKADYPEAIPLGYDSDANLFITLCQQYGIPFTSLDEVNQKGKIDFNNAAAKAMAAKVIDWMKKGYLVTAATSNGAYTSTLFTEGKLFMSVGSTGGTGYNYTAQIDEIGVAPMFKPDFEHPFQFGGTLGLTDNIIMQGPSICFFRKSTAKEREAAWTFYKFITRTIWSASFSTVSGYSPIRESSFTCDAMVEYLESEQTGEDALYQKVIKNYSSLTSRYFVSPAFHGSSTARSQVDGIFSSVFDGTKTLDQAFSEAYAKAEFATR